MTPTSPHCSCGLIVIQQAGCVAALSPFPDLGDCLAAENHSKRERKQRKQGCDLQKENHQIARRPVTLGDVLYAQGARVSGDGAQITVSDRTGEQVGRVIAEHQIVISELVSLGGSLEDVYFELTGATGGPS